MQRICISLHTAWTLALRRLILINQSTDIEVSGRWIGAKKWSGRSGVQIQVYFTLLSPIHLQTHTYSRKRLGLDEKEGSLGSLDGGPHWPDDGRADTYVTSTADRIVKVENVLHLRRVLG
jgi:hypothetical protein